MTTPTTAALRTGGKYLLMHVCEAAYRNDLEFLAKLLNKEDEENGYRGNINYHLTEENPLMYAAFNGSVEAVEMLLEANADPHMKANVGYGKEPEDGMTAKQYAASQGYDDIVDILDKAMKSTPVGHYMRYGINNNSPLPVFELGTTGKGKDPFEGMELTEEDRIKGQWSLGGGAAGGVPTTTIGLMFPGQGSQYVKMMTGVASDPFTVQCNEHAKQILGLDLLKLCIEGPEEQLEFTVNCQPAMYMAGACALEILRKSRKEAADTPGCVAGLSLGEYTALYAAGVFSFEDGLELVKIRGKAMNDAASARPQAMLSVAGLDQGKLEPLCKEAAAKEADGVCGIANILFPKGFSCAGTKACIDELKVKVEAAGAIQAKVLKTSGGFHTSLMSPALPALEEALNRILPKMKPPKCDVYMNVTGKKIAAGTHPREIVPLLKRQLTSEVKWEDCVRGMIASDMTEFYEVGPMKQLKAMMKRIDATMWTSTQSIEI